MVVQLSLRQWYTDTFPDPLQRTLQRHRSSSAIHTHWAAHVYCAEPPTTRYWQLYERVQLAYVIHWRNLEPAQMQVRSVRNKTLNWMQSTWCTSLHSLSYCSQSVQCWDQSFVTAWASHTRTIFKSSLSPCREKLFSTESTAPLNHSVSTSHAKWYWFRRSNTHAIAVENIPA